MQVMIFVVLAIAFSCCPFFENKIRPLSASIKTADWAYKLSGSSDSARTTITVLPKVPEKTIQQIKINTVIRFLILWTALPSCLFLFIMSRHSITYYVISIYVGHGADRTIFVTMYGPYAVHNNLFSPDSYISSFS